VATMLWKQLYRALLSWFFAAVLLVTLLAVTLAYQFDTAHTVDVGDYYDRVYVQGFHEREISSEQEGFRWSEAEATVLFPGVGARDRWLSLRLHGYRPDGQAPSLRISVNGHLLARTTAGSFWQEYLLWVPAQASSDGTLRVTLEAETFLPQSDARELGVAVSRVALLPPQGGGFSPGWPAWDQLGWALLFAAALYLSLVAVGLPRWAAALAAGLANVPLAWALALQRLWTTIYTSRLAILALLGLLFVLIFKWLFRRILAWGKVSVGGKELRLLLAIFLVGFLLKAGGLLYPYSVAVDLKLQLQWSSWILNGRLPELYGTNSPLNEKTMPVEWGEEKPLIPYSPFYHMTAATFFFLPWRPYDTANVLSVLLDTTRPFLLYFLARRLGLSSRTGLWAALLYAAFPATFLLHAWGNTPTTTGLWWMFAALCYLVGAWERLRHPRTWAGLVFFFLGAMLYYTVMAAFTVIFVGILLLALVGNRRRLRVHSAGPVALALLAALGLSLAIYYGQYIGPVVRETIPQVVESLQRGGQGLGTVPVPWPEYIRSNLTRLAGLNYGLLLPLGLALASLFTGWRRAEWDPQPRSLRRSLLIAWFGTALLFFVIGFRVDLVDKEIWFAMPAVALCAAVALEGFWQKGTAGRLLALVTSIYLAAAALISWFGRLATVRQDWLASDAPIVGQRLLQWGIQALRLLLRA
jgi:hypothetical protein